MKNGYKENDKEKVIEEKIISNEEFAKYSKRKKVLETSLNIMLSRNGYQFEAKKFVTDKGILDFVVRDPKTKELVFVILVEKKIATFRYKEDWEKLFTSRNIIYGVRWYLRKHKQENENFRIDIVEMYEDIKSKKIKAKIYKNPKVLRGNQNINTREFILVTFLK